MAKGVVTAYALWAIGGPLGLHHLYLGRDSHALLWLLTLGGFGVGWAREVFRIPAYVNEANREAAGRTERRRQARPPPMSVARFAGQVCVGIYFGVVALIGLSSLNFFNLIVLPLSVGAGVHLVSCAGLETSDLWKTLTTCLITSPIFYGSTLSPLPISLAASVTAAQHRQFKPPRATNVPPEPLVSRLYRLGLAWLAFSAPLGYCVFHNTTATLYYLSDCFAAVLDALWFFPWLKGVLEYLLLLPYRVLCAVTGGGGGGEAEDFWRKVLSVSKEASLEEITHSYRELVKVWHPDHNPTRAQEAQQMFIQIQEAYETLLRRHKAFRRR
ncbi:hypothetical protein JZ751_021689 [Albula glossodonta]|uniref:DnaJ homolog subfamily C member 22 n=1 Tax=Albula glossodonta TaxID=121402 RepID=A0A8T2NRT8_9TELE|nr:hypothetical protein JZ751_021689 [Albula glossodonta]